MIINVFRVKIKNVDFTMFSFLFYNKVIRVEFFVGNRTYLRYIHNNVVIINEFINICDNNYDDDARQIEEKITIDFEDKNATLFIIEILT